MLYRDAKLVQFRIGFWHEIDKPCIQTAGSYGFKLLQTRRWLKLQFRLGLLLSESPERIWNNAAPRRIFCEQPIDLELGLAKRTIYWTDRGDSPLGNTVNRAPMDVAAGDAPRVLLGGLQVIETIRKMSSTHEYCDFAV